MRYVVMGLAVMVVLAIGCRRGDPADKMIEMVDTMPAKGRPAGWEHTKALMTRRAPAVGEQAPDFTLKTLDGSKTVTLSSFYEDRPRVLIFGSYT